MTVAQRVQVFSIGTPKKGTPKEQRRYRVKWRIDGRDRTRSLKSRRDADRLHARLLAAVDAGEFFDPGTGEPASWALPADTWFAWSQQWLTLKWPQWAGTTRKTAVETLTAITPVMVPTTAPPPPEDLAGWLKTHGYRPAPLGQAPPTLPWLERWSLPLRQIRPDDIERVLAAVTTRQDGQPMSAAVIRRRKNTLGAVLKSAVRRDLLDRNPMDRIEWRAPSRDLSVDVATVPSPRDVLRLVDHVAAMDGQARRYAALFACVGLAGMRPSEAISLRVEDLDLPESGWGTARLAGATTEPGAAYTNTGQRWETKNLKHRAEGTTRNVPLPPPLVQRLRTHLDDTGRAAGLLFTNSNDKPATTANYSPVFQRARSKVWTEDHLVAATLYDLRHAAATMMLTAGVPPAEVARRLGHSLDVLLRVYAGVVTEEIDRSNELIDAALTNQ